MKKTSQMFILLILMSIATFTSCKKDDDSSQTTPTAARSFLKVTFDLTHAFFATDGTMTAPVDSNAAKAVANRIDFRYFYNTAYDNPGFGNPVFCSQHSGSSMYASWLSVGVDTKFYTTTLTKADFDAAQNDQSKIAPYFSLSGTVLAAHSPYPAGSYIGSGIYSNEYLQMNTVYGFINTASGKHGLLFIRNDQYQYWPVPIYDEATKVDIIKEN
jgi:hypothetical protein